MRSNSLFFALPIALTASLFAGSVSADWSMDPARSHLAFVSIKAKDIGEVNTFTKMTGMITDDGQVQVAMMLDSVDTLIPIRNERMREFLFRTADYKEATLTAKVDPEWIESIKPGEISEITAEGTLALHGTTQPMILSMQAAMVNEDTIMVASTKPLIIDAAKFGMSEGVEKLREIAGLSEISNAVPVTFVIIFVDIMNSPEISQSVNSPE